MLFLVILGGCKKEDPDWEAATVKDVRIEPAAITAYVTARFEYGEKHELFFEYSDYDDMLYAHRYPMVADGDGKYHTTVYNLEGSSDYYYRFVARSKYGTKEMEISKFSTVELFMPTIVTKPVYNITVFSGTSGGDIPFDGGAPVKRRGVCWGLQPNPTINDSVIPCESGSGSFSALIAGLTPETTYYVRAFATNKAGTAYGQEESFTTGRITLPEVSTGHLTLINRTWAIGTGEVLDEGGLSVTERGLCWSIHPQPTIQDQHQKNGIGIGFFRVVLSNLMPDMNYYMRAYAINGKGITYGDEVEFVTPPVPPTPEGALNGIFTVANRKQVWFSRGNLQYQASPLSWRFAEEQYQCIGSSNENIAQDYNGWIDLFGWGTSGWSGSGAVCYKPYSTSIQFTDYHTGGILNAGLFDEYLNCDWGYYNRISNGGNTSRQWSTLTQEEWNYLLNVRYTVEGIRYAKATVNDIPGLLILPDDWNSRIDSLNQANNPEASFISNVFTCEEWAVLEQANVVFLPAAGRRFGTFVLDVLSNGYYWSSSGYPYSVSDAYSLLINDFEVGSSFNQNVPYGSSVRLVRVIP